MSRSGFPFVAVQGDMAAVTPCRSSRPFGAQGLSAIDAALFGRSGSPHHRLRPDRFAIPVSVATPRSGQDVRRTLVAFMAWMGPLRQFASRTVEVALGPDRDGSGLPGGEKRAMQA